METETITIVVTKTKEGNFNVNLGAKPDLNANFVSWALQTAAAQVNEAINAKTAAYSIKDITPKKSNIIQLKNEIQC